MAVNFGILQPIQAPQVVANLPQQSNINPLTNLGTGIQNAVQNMQGAQLNNLQIDKAKIDLDEAKTAQEKRRNYDEIVKQSNGNFDNYVKAVSKVDPIMAMDAMNKRQQIQNLVEQTRGNKATADKAEMSNATEYWAQLGNLASSAMQLARPDGTPFDQKTKAAYFNKGLEFFPDTLKQGLKKIAPEGFTESNAIVLITEGAMAQASMAKGKEVAPSDTKKRLDEVNAARVAAGQAPMTAQEQAATLEKGLGTSIDPSKGQVNPVDSALAQVDAKQAGDLANTRQSMTTLYNDAKEVEKLLPSVPGWATGPIAKGLNLDKLSPDAQKIISPLNAMALQLKDYYKLGSGQGFTDADRDFLTEIAGNTGFYKYSLKYINERMQTIAQAAEYNAWKKEDAIRQGGAPEKYKLWKQNNPEPLNPAKQPKKAEDKTDSVGKILTYNPQTGKLE